MASFRLCRARKRLVVIVGKSNSSFRTVLQDNPEAEEYRIQELNETEQWINETKESKKKIQRRARGEL
jgi:hypothetical protein